MEEADVTNVEEEGVLEDKEVSMDVTIVFEAVGEEQKDEEKLEEKEDAEEEGKDVRKEVEVTASVTEEPPVTLVYEVGGDGDEMGGVLPKQ
ncbi:hypothetical protein N7462_001644 [Penicillium macrosclerotiorum]|uniref:uncharacterized protein n=1 Tax=Penicillium macrosclerotiorum TaxID=303699 RepID=UPI002549ADD7|nr:uncharacterized protein N7462_001644 [Penicillium macrosclerotiorum]KAJ5692221.1 hypothetical protein N7462_001644 [Penicillium macrosclerotiorum]